MNLLGIIISLACICICCVYTKGAASITFVSEPDDPLYVFNETNVTLRWEYKISGSKEGLFAISWSVIINGSYAEIARIKFGSSYSPQVLIGSLKRKLLLLTPTTLVIKNFSDQDVTTYQIKLFHLDVVEVKEGNVTIIRAVPPSINPIANVTAAEGRKTDVRCNASGIPPPKLTWKKRGSSDVLSNETIFLVRKNISRGETGWYQCIATNGFGNPASQQVYIDVHYPPDIKELTTSNSSSFIGQHVIFCCYSDGNPPPTYRWIFPNGNSLNQNGKCLDVELNTRHNFGNYSCVVSNANGNDTETANIRQLFPPDKISRINYDARPFGIFLSWNKTKYDGGSKVIRYIVLIFGKSDGQTSQTNYDVKQLTRNTNYTICVRAENIVGKSNKTCAVIQTLNKGKPEQPSITIVPVGTTGVRITWSKPSPDVLYYIVKYTKEGWNHWTERNKTGSLLTFELKDLKPGKYAVQLIAVNGYGESSPSENKTFTISPPFTISPSATTTLGTTSTSTGKIPGKKDVTGGANKNMNIIIIISVLLALLCIIACVFIFFWLKRRSGRGESPPESNDHIPGPVNGDVYATVDTSQKPKKPKKPKKKEKNPNELVYAELSELAPAAAEDKPASYEPTDYADITHILTPKADLVYSNVAPRCSEEGAYANVQEMKK